MKPYDVIVALRLAIASEDDRARPTSWLAKSLGLSTSRIHESLRRLHRVRIVDPAGNRVVESQLLEFLEHGIRFVFPADVGAVTRGFPTASSAPPLADVFPDGDAESRFVWPHASGTVRGSAIAPLHSGVPAIAEDDPAMYRLLALVDAARLDDPRLRREAIAALKSELGARV